MLKFTLELGQSSLTEMIKLEVYLTEQLRKLYQLMKNDVWSKAHEKHSRCWCCSFRLLFMTHESKKSWKKLFSLFGFDIPQRLTWQPSKDQVKTTRSCEWKLQINYIHRLYFNVTEVPVAWMICFSFHSQIYTYMCDLFFQSFQLHLLVFISDRSVQADVKTIYFNHFIFNLSIKLINIYRFNGVASSLLSQKYHH